MREGERPSAGPATATGSSSHAPRSLTEGRSTEAARRARLVDLQRRRCSGAPKRSECANGRKTGSGEGDDAGMCRLVVRAVRRYGARAADVDHGIGRGDMGRPGRCGDGAGPARGDLHGLRAPPGGRRGVARTAGVDVQGRHARNSEHAQLLQQRHIQADRRAHPLGQCETGSGQAGARLRTLDERSARERHPGGPACRRATTSSSAATIGRPSDGSCRTTTDAEMI